MNYTNIIWLKYANFIITLQIAFKLAHFMIMSGKVFTQIKTQSDDVFMPLKTFSVSETKKILTFLKETFE